MKWQLHTNLFVDFWTQVAQTRQVNVEQGMTMSQQSLFTPTQLGAIDLRNRFAMAPMTRTRASTPGDIPNDLMAEYYAQRASAGLIITEATHVSPQAVGYVWVPGMWTEAQVEGWKNVVGKVHAAGGKIVSQLFHTGRMSHPYFQSGNTPVAPSSSIPVGQTALVVGYHGEVISVPLGEPVALSDEGIADVQAQFAHAVRNAKAAGFNGVEIHAANGYLLEQFLNPNVNQRTDRWGGTAENRMRLTLDVIDDACLTFGADRVGVRFSPFGLLHDQPAYDATETYLALAEELANRKLAYIHLFNQAAFGSGDLSYEFVRTFRSACKTPIIVAGNLTGESASALIDDATIDVAAFGRPFIANPDLPARIEHGYPLAEADQSTWYGNTSHGYTDYPTYAR
jgi:N-ethylmaleimide reductase